MEQRELGKATIPVPGMTCDCCAERVQDALLAVPGVRLAKSSAWRKRVTVRFEPSRVGPAEIRSALADKGFESGEARA